MQTIFLLALLATDAYDVARSGELMRLAGTYATIIALFVLVHVACGARKRANLIASCVLYTIFVALGFARFETTGAFDYGFAHENVRELLTPLGRRIVTAQTRPLDTLLLLVLPLAAGLLVLRRRPTPPCATPGSTRALLALGCVAVLAGFPAAGLVTHECITSFAASAYRFHVEDRDEEVSADAPLFPFVHDAIPSEAAGALSKPGQRRPHVIVLFLESWSDIYTDRRDADGHELTPTYDAHRREGLTFDHFYGSSIQSSRGRFATMCSLIPLYRGKEFAELADAPLHCLPRVLAEAGYETFLYSASDEPDFERSSEFFAHLGFADVRFEDPTQRGHDPRMWGAGLQDDVYYRRLFAALDEKLVTEPDAPIFAVAINASNHYPFDKNPGHVPDPAGATKYARNYVGSLRASDAWLATFFEELDRRPALRDAVVVLVGDHSFPADEHGSHFNGLGAHEESFRTAFSLRWRGHVPPTLVTDRAASQIDVAPTITDLLQIHQTSHFVGRSLFKGDEPVPVPMVQPYDGVRLAAVLYPFKLEVHDSSQQEHLYDLSVDPDEQHDLYGAPSLAARTAILRGTIARIRESQAILRANRVWPGTGTERVSIAK
ncbi:MAG: Phosphoglycerol transferase [Myxococcaceae bacterium]|nr:Phosphoglycerol transferase [Myxococcaceae bacterium]